MRTGIIMHKIIKQMLIRLTTKLNDIEEMVDDKRIKESIKRENNLGNYYKM